MVRARVLAYDKNDIRVVEIVQRNSAFPNANGLAKALAA
jgi:hypothetical protein